MQIVTFANRAPTEPYYCFREMLASCRRFGHDPLVLGWGETWGGLGSKPKLLLRAIEQGRIIDPHILLLDAYDTLMARPPCDIMAEYHKFRTPIVWGAERNLFPEIPCDRDAVFPASPGGFRYLNSGVCVAETAAMLWALKRIDAEGIPADHYNPDGSVTHYNDQEIWLKAYAADRRIMTLDNDCTIALNMHSVHSTEIDLSGEQVFCVPTVTAPCVIHFNGGSKTDGLMPLVLKKLGY
jgi:hypothetical protein